MMIQAVETTLLLTCLGLLPTLAMAAEPQDLPTVGKIGRFDPRLDEIIPQDAKIEVLASGFDWSEGPVWVKEKIRFFSQVNENTAVAKEKEGGFLIFSDVPRNEVLRWTAAEGISVFMKPSGYTGIIDYRPEPGSNGLAVDREGRIAFCEHGDRRVSLLYKEGGKRTLADNYEGKRLNSPNDLVFNSKGDLYFTDPPYGLPEQLKDSRCELGYCGVYRLPGATPGGKLTLLTKELTRPNGLAFSPDEKTLYVANSDPAKAIWMAYEVQPDGGIDKGRVFFDATSLAKKHKGLPDGMKVDLDGNIYATGPGGIFIFAPDGTHLGMLYTGQATGNCAWGDDGSTLYICADMYLCRVRLKTKGF